MTLFQRFMNPAGIRSKFFVSFAVMLALIFSMGVVAIAGFENMASLNQYLISTVLSGVAVSGSLDAEISSVRRADVEHILATDPATRNRAAGAIRNAEKIAISDLALLHASADTGTEKRIVASLTQELPQFLRDNDRLLALTKPTDIKALYTGAPYRNFRQITGLINQFVEINKAQAFSAKREISESQNRLAATILVTIALTVAATLAALAVLVRGIIWPLLAMTRAMGELADGKLETPVPAAGRRDEIGQLAQAMAHFKALAQGLRAAKEQAEAGTKAKSEFLANMGHELRTPLNAIVGFSEMISQEMLGPAGCAKNKEYLAAINSSGVHLLALINDVLAIVRIDQGGDRLQEEIVQLDTIIAAAIRTAGHLPGAAHIRFTEEMDPAIRSVYADGKRLTQVLANLIGNAVKFTAANGQVTVRAFRRERELVISVSDTGIGMAACDIPRALERFGQIDSRLARQYEGSGLGLPIAKHLVELHGGRLTIKSKPGVGTTVTVALSANRIVKQSASAAA